MRINRPFIAWTAAALVAAGIGLAALLGSGATPAHADAQCAAKCNAAHGECMKPYPDRAKCDTERNICLKACGGG